MQIDKVIQFLMDTWLIQDVENDIDLYMEDKWLNSEEEANEI